MGSSSCCISCCTWLHSAAVSVIVSTPRQAFLPAGGPRILQRGQYPIVTPVRGQLKTNRTYGLFVSEFYFLKPPHWGDNRILPDLQMMLAPSMVSLLSG